MATHRWKGTAQKASQVSTIAASGTWATSDTATLTINGVDLTLTLGTDVATTDVVEQLANMINGGDVLNDETYSAVGTSYGEWREITATAASSTLTLTGTIGVPFTVTRSESTAGSGALGAVTSVTSATGPNDLNNAENWTGGSVPGSGDTAVFDQGNVDVKYNLDAISAADVLEVWQGYTGKLGLAEWNVDNPSYPYYEYRTQYVTLDDHVVRLGLGEGGGSGMMNFTCGSAATVISVFNTGQRAFSGRPAVRFDNLGSSSTVEVLKGDVGLSDQPGLTACTVTTLRVSYVDNQDSDATVYVGASSSVAALVQNGGSVESRGAITTATLDGGSLFVTDAGSVTTLVLREGYCEYSGSGTLATATVAGTGHLDFGRDLTAKTVTNPIEVFGDKARISDPNKVVGSLVVDMNYGADLSRLNIGRNVRITRGTPA